MVFLMIVVSQVFSAYPYPNSWFDTCVKQAACIFLEEDDAGQGPITKVLGGNWADRYICDRTSKKFSNVEGRLLTLEVQRYWMNPKKLNFQNSEQKKNAIERCYRKRDKYFLNGIHVMSKWFDHKGQQVGAVEYASNYRTMERQKHLQVIIDNILKHQTSSHENYDEITPQWLHLLK